MGGHSRYNKTWSWREHDSKGGSFGPTTESLMLGKGVSYFGQVAMNHLRQLTNPYLLAPYIPKTWEVIDPKSVSECTASHYIYLKKNSWSEPKTIGNFGSTLK